MHHWLVIYINRTHIGAGCSLLCVLEHSTKHLQSRQRLGKAEKPGAPGENERCKVGYSSESIKKSITQSREQNCTLFIPAICLSNSAAQWLFALTIMQAFFSQASLFAFLLTAWVYISNSGHLPPSRCWDLGCKRAASKYILLLSYYTSTAL